MYSSFKAGISSFWSKNICDTRETYTAPHDTQGQHETFKSQGAQYKTVCSKSCKKRKKESKIKDFDLMKNQLIQSEKTKMFFLIWQLTFSKDC